MSARAGTRLDGRYRLSERIAVGGMGEVWRGTDEVLGRSVAVKILRAELAEDEAFRKRFRAEARTAGSLPHSGIAAVFDYGETTVGPDGVSPSTHPVQGDGIAYLVMELVPGEALSAILARDGALGTERTLAYLAQAARALHAAHARGVVHRDVKPANLMVTPEGRVKVTDFGIARPVDHEPLTMTGQVMGTAHYLAPELARGHEASALSDVYALGVVAYECLAGHRPFEGDNQVLVATAHLSQQPPPLPGTLPPDVVRAVAAAMEKDPDHRVRSAEAFAVVLEKLLAHDPTALDETGGGRETGGGNALQQAQAPTMGPDGIAVPRGGGGRHSGAAGAGAAAAQRAAGEHDTDAGEGASIAATTGLGAAGAPSTGTGRPVGAQTAVGQWPASQAPPNGRSGPDGGPGYYDEDGERAARRRGRGPSVPPAMLLIIGLLALLLVLILVIAKTASDPGGRVDPATEPTPTVEISATPTGSPTASASTSPSASLSPSATRSRSTSTSPSSTTTSPSPSASPSPSPSASSSPTASVTSPPASSPASSPSPSKSPVASGVITPVVVSSSLADAGLLAANGG